MSGGRQRSVQGRQHLLRATAPAPKPNRLATAAPGLLLGCTVLRPTFRRCRNLSARCAITQHCLPACPPLPPGCPFCRKVREAVAILDLDVKFMPCPKVRSRRGKGTSRVLPEHSGKKRRQFFSGRSSQDPAFFAGFCALPNARDYILPALYSARGYSQLAASLVPAGPLQDGPTWRPEAVGKSGKRQFPYMEVRACCDAVVCVCVRVAAGCGALGSVGAV